MYYKASILLHFAVFNKIQQSYFVIIATIKMINYSLKTNYIIY